MSFVGPRPERPQFVEDLETRLPYYAERHMVKPGITGWAQINYPYGASSEDSRQKLEYDIYYAKNYSPFLDLLILLKTIRVDGLDQVAGDGIRRQFDELSSLKREAEGDADANAAQIDRRAREDVELL